MKKIKELNRKIKNGSNPRINHLNGNLSIERERELLGVRESNREREKNGGNGSSNFDLRVEASELRLVSGKASLSQI